MPQTAPAPPPVRYRRLEMVAARFAQIIAESLDGRRSLGQLEARFDADSLAQIVEHHGDFSGTKVRLGSIRVQPRSNTCAEVTLRLTTEAGDHAAALRVYRANGRWWGSELVIG